MDVSNVDFGVAHVAMAIHACFKCFIYFRRMLQMFHLDIVKVDLVLNMLQWDHPPQPPVGAVGAPLSGRRRSPTTCAWEEEEARGTPHVLLVGRAAHAVRVAWASRGARKTGVGAGNGLLGRASVRSRALAIPNNVRWCLVAPPKF